MDMYRTITTCRLCGASHLQDVMAFGEQYVATSFVRETKDQPRLHAKMPLTLVLCGECGLVQLRETVDREALFQEYFYRSRTNPMMREALQDIVQDVVPRLAFRDGDWALDIGCNDGTLLSFLPDRMKRIGVEPASNIDWSGLDASITIVNDFFSRDKVLGLTQGQVCRMVTSIAMLYSVEDVNAVAQDIKAILAPDGLWCIQVAYLPATLESLGFYDVCHEHLYYFTLGTLSRLVTRHGFRICDASLNRVNGGSLRVLVTHQDDQTQPTSENVLRILEKEQEQRLSTPATYERFYEEVLALRSTIVDFIRQERGGGKEVIGLGASTKGNVLLQFFGIDKTLIPYLSDRNPDKVGLKTLGTDIEVVSEEKARALNPSCMLVLIWFFKEEILKREKTFLDQGGRLLFPMPYCHLVGRDGETRL